MEPSLIFFYLPVLEFVGVVGVKYSGLLEESTSKNSAHALRNRIREPSSYTTQTATFIGVIGNNGDRLRSFPVKSSWTPTTDTTSGKGTNFLFPKTLIFFRFIDKFKL